MKKFLSFAFILFYLGQLNAQIFFSSLTSYSLGAFPIGVTSSDFNKDGYLDLATTNQNSNNISISFGTGTGSFGSPTFYTVGNSPRCITSADFNNDGNLDLAVANNNIATVSILLGTSTGVFGIATTLNLTIGANSSSIVSNDFNGDGNMDVATVNTNLDNVSLFLGTGTGSFGSANYFSVGSTPMSMTTADFNGDGKADLATSNEDSNAGISILLGTGTGSFLTAISYGGGNYVSLTSSDFNGDGKTDLAVIDQVAKAAYIFLGTNTGSLNYLTSYPIGSSAVTIVSTDFNRDGKKDLAVTNSNDNNISIFLGTGIGTFGIATNISAGSHPYFVTCGDFNGDGNTDIALSNGDGNADIGVLLNEFPYFNINGTTSICMGSNTTLVANGANNYTWSPTNGLNTTTGPTVIANPTVTTTYTITGVKGDTIGKTAIKITIVPNPTITLYSTTICEGQQATLSASGANTYSWNTGAVSSSVILSPPATTIYTVTGTNGGICSAIQTASINVNPNPIISVSGGNSQTICSGDSVLGIFFAVNPSGLTVNWTNNNTAIGLAAANSGNISGFSAPIESVQKTGIVVATATISATGCYSSITYSITINPLPNITVNSPTICTGATVLVTASGANTYTWNNGTIGNTITPSPTVTTYYTVTGADINNCTNKATSTVTINSSLTAPIVTINTPTICTGATTTLTANGASTYTWSTAATGVSITPSPTATTNYMVTGTDTNNCTSIGTTTITVYPLPVVTVNSSTICSGATTTLISSGANTYTWNTNDTGANISPSPTVTTNYTVTGTDINGCVNSNTSTVTLNAIPLITVSSTDVSCFGLSNGSATVSISGNSPYTYSWSPNGGNGTIANNLAIGNYSLDVTDINNCNSSASLSINQPTLLSTSASQTTKDCGNSNGVATSLAIGGTLPYLYVWSTIPSQVDSIAINLSAGVYTCTVQDANGCSSIASIAISDSCDMVWPGDANNDLIADNNDILAIGIGNSTNGTIRNNATINWTAQPSTNWTDTLANGVNYKHIDCDGNGAINLDDTVAVIQNFNLTHPTSKLSDPNQTYTSGVPLILVPQQYNILSGNTGTFNIILGNSTTPITNAYGIAFTMQYDNTYIDGTSICINGIGSWLGNINNNMMALALKNIPQSETEFAVTRTDHNNLTGQGKIGEIVFKTLTNLTNNSVVSFSISNVTLISYDQTNIPVDLSAATTTVNIVTTTGINQVSNGNNFNIYPNPNNGTFTIETNNSANQTIQIFDINGRLVLNQTIVDKTKIIANDLMDGVYNIGISSREGIINKRLVIVR